MGEVKTYRATETAIETTAIVAHSLDEATLQHPNGAYTVVPIYEGGRVLRLDRHFARMDHTLHLMGIETPFDHAALRDVMRRCVELAGFEPARLRLTVPGDEPGVLYVSLQAWTPAGEELYTRGVSAVTTDLVRERPRAKSTHFIKPRAALMETLPEGVYEALLVGPDGKLLEGAGSNFYAVLNGALRTAHEDVLVGVARSIVLDACAQEPPIPVTFEPLDKKDLPAISEAMLSGVSRGVLAIVEIDDQAVGDGAPGPVSIELRRRYEAIMAEELEPLQESGLVNPIQTSVN